MGRLRVVPGVVAETGGAGRYVLGLAVSRAARPLAVAVAGCAGLAVLPAVQVHAVAWLVRSLVDQHRSTSYVVRGPVVVTAVAATLGMTLLAWSQQAKLRLAYRLQTVSYDRLNRASATRPPSEFAAADATAALQAARDAVQPLASMPGYLIDVLGAVVTAATLSAAIWTMNHAAAALVVLALVPTMVAYLALARFQKASTRDLAEHQRRANYHTENLVYQRPLTELAALGTAGRVADLADRERRAIEDNRRRYLRLCAVCEGLNALATLILLGAAIALLVGDGRAGAAAGGVLGVISGITATRGAGFAMGQIMVSAPQVNAYRAVAEPARNPTPMPVLPAARLSCRALGVTYPGSPRPALTGVDVSVERGQLVALVGANGAGKTTLVNALMGLVPATTGQVMIDGATPADTDQARWLGHFGLLTQEFGRYELTIRENLLLGLPTGQASDEHLWEALHAAQADGFVRAMPAGLDTQLGPQWAGVGISGGQWQRLALARIHLRNPGIWILDEPTSAIDAESEMRIFDELAQHRGDRITIVVSHRAVTLQHMDLIHVLDHGHIVETGTYHDLLQQRGRFWRIFREQAAAHQTS